MKILLLGGTGLAGQAFCNELLDRNFFFKTVARKNADISLDISKNDHLISLLLEENPDLVINAAAQVDIDSCKMNYEESWNINCRVPSIINYWSTDKNKAYLHISTDHFFSEGGNKAHLENDSVSLINEYAIQKYAAESICLTSPNALIIRTSIVGFKGWGNKTFAEWAIDSIINDKEMTLFEDAWTSSIDIGSFARGALDLLIDHKARGLYNLGCKEVYSKAHFIEELASQLNKKIFNYKKGSISNSLPNRASSLGLDVTKAQNLLKWELPNLKQVIQQIVKESKKS